MDRRSFLRTLSLAAVGGIFVPKYERWFQPTGWNAPVDGLYGMSSSLDGLNGSTYAKWSGEGVYFDVVHTPPVMGQFAGAQIIRNDEIDKVIKNVYQSYRIEAFPLLTPILAMRQAPGRLHVVPREPTRRGLFRRLRHG